VKTYSQKPKATLLCRRPRAQDRSAPPGPRSLLYAARIHWEGRPLL